LWAIDFLVKGKGNLFNLESQLAGSISMKLRAFKKTLSLPFSTTFNQFYFAFLGAASQNVVRTLLLAYNWQLFCSDLLLTSPSHVLLLPQSSKTNALPCPVACLIEY
jgi:hypothetical protein